MENKEKLVLDFSVEMFLKWHSDLYLGYDRTINFYNDIDYPIITLEYFNIIQSMVTEWSLDRLKLYYYVKVINAKDIDKKAVKFAFKQAKKRMIELIDIDLLELWNNENPISGHYIADKLDKDSEDFIEKLEQSDAIKTTYAAANLVNIKIYQWLCEYEKEYDREIITPSVLETGENESVNGLNTKEKIQLLTELGFFELDMVLKMKVKDRNKIITLLIERNQDNIKKAINGRQKSKINAFDPLSIINKITGESDD